MSYFYFMLAASSQIATLNLMREEIIIVSLIGPRGGCLAGACDPRVSDNDHHRLLGWSNVPTDDNSPADLVNGQTDFGQEGRNAKGSPGPATLNAPTGITPRGDGLALADAWNYRALIWGKLPRGHNVPADLVLGQQDFESVEPNRGKQEVSAGSLFWPYGVHWDGAKLWVADTGNRRVPIRHGLPKLNGQSADLVLGHSDFVARDENAGGNPTTSSMYCSHSVMRWCRRLCVVDAGNNRIMVWNAIANQNNRPCDLVLGQYDFHLADQNQSLYWPYGVMQCGGLIIVSDSCNNRVLLWRLAEGRTP